MGVFRRQAGRGDADADADAPHIFVDDVVTLLVRRERRARQLLAVLTASTAIRTYVVDDATNEKDDGDAT